MPREGKPQRGLEEVEGMPGRGRGKRKRKWKRRRKRKRKLEDDGDDGDDGTKEESDLWQEQRIACE
jgi:hypothetical protein